VKKHANPNLSWMRLEARVSIVESYIRISVSGSNEDKPKIIIFEVRVLASGETSTEMQRDLIPLHRGSNPINSVIVLMLLINPT